MKSVSKEKKSQATRSGSEKESRSSDKVKTFADLVAKVYGYLYVAADLFILPGSKRGRKK